MENNTNTIQGMTQEPAPAAQQDPAQNSTQEPAQQTGAPSGGMQPDEMMRTMQAEIDRRVTQALAKQRKEYEKKLSLSGLDEPQRQLAERDATIAELQEQLKAAQSEHNRIELMKTLAAHSLPADFAEVIEISEDATVMLDRVNRLETVFKNAVEEGVKARLSGKNAPGRATMQTAAMTKEQFAKLPLAQMQKLHDTNPELYKALTDR